MLFNLLKFQAPKSSLAHLGPYVSLQSHFLFVAITLFNYSLKKVSPRPKKNPCATRGGWFFHHLPHKLVCLLINHWRVTLLLLPSKVQSLPALPNHLQPDDKRTLCLDGCLTIYNVIATGLILFLHHLSGFYLLNMSTGWISAWNILRHLLIASEEHSSNDSWSNYGCSGSLLNPFTTLCFWETWCWCYLRSILAFYSIRFEMSFF